MPSLLPIDLSAFDTTRERDPKRRIAHHVVAGEVPSSAVTDGLAAAAVNGDDLYHSRRLGHGQRRNRRTCGRSSVQRRDPRHHKVLMPPADEPEVTEADGDICQHGTHTVVAGASFEECMAYAYYEDYERTADLHRLPNMVTHTFTMVSQ